MTRRVKDEIPVRSVRPDQVPRWNALMREIRNPSNGSIPTNCRQTKCRTSTTPSEVDRSVKQDNCMYVMLACEVVATQKQLETRGSLLNAHVLLR